MEIFMNITFNDSDLRVGSFLNVAGSTTSNSTASSQNVRSSGISLDITSGMVTDNNAYRGQGGSTKDVMMSAQAKEITLSAERDYMTVMSNCVSTEDFSRMQKEGFKPGSTEIDDVVTIVDHIKAAVLQGGTSVAGYTDTISDEALKSITGSESFANDLKNEAAVKDIPLTEDIVKEIEDAYKELSSIGQLSESGIKYMVENHMDPSVDNIYTAAYAGGNNANAQGHGYYGAGVSGYYAKKPESIDIESLKPQMEGIIKEAGYEATDENMKAAAWLVEKGVPLTADTFTQYKKVTDVSLPMSHSEFADHATDAVLDGIKVRKADLSRKTSLRTEAIDINNEVQTLGTIKGRRVLEEVRLSMTVEANLKLLRSGYAIDTAPMEELVDNLKQIENEFAINLTHDEDEIEAVRKKDLYDTTVDTVGLIKTAPISISIVYEEGEALKAVGNKAKILTNEYVKATASYETLMTAPRADMGDSINKAFRNVDDILNDMDIPLTEENRRAVRILGYNNMEISDDNIDTVVKKDRLLTDTLEQLTPGRVLNMIRTGKNPLMMSVAELNEYLSVQDTTKDDLLSYSKFLTKLDRANDITEEERSAYIGIYRLVHQIEKSDHNSIGVIEQTGAQFNFENILSGLRSRKNKNMDYRVDDSFGGVDILDRGIESITTQIAKGYVHDVDDILMVLDKAFSQEAEAEYQKEEFDKVREAFNVEEEVLEQLKNMGTPITAENIADMEIMMNSPSSVFKRLRDIGMRRTKSVDLENKTTAKESYHEFTGSIKDFLRNDVFGDVRAQEELRAQDIRLRAQMYQHMEFLTSQADEENYQIPVEINGELTSINLKVLHGEDEASNVAISFTSDTYGKLAAQFGIDDQGWSGYISCTNKEGAKLLNDNRASLVNELGTSGISIKDISIADSKNIDLKAFNNKVTQDRKTDTDVVSTDKLYKAAKIFIAYVENIAA